MHQPVLVNEVVALLAVKPGGIYVDATVGNGGHAAAILEKTGPMGKLLGIDRDKDALDRAGHRLKDLKCQVVLEHGNYAEMVDIAKRNEIERVDGILLDLGVSSEQLDTPSRGFSFGTTGPLDMRMDQSSGRTAADLASALDEEELERILREFGEEPRARRIARAITRERKESPITSTGQLAALIERAAGGRRGRIHPATRSFQALRMAVNDELTSLRLGLAGALELLAEGGRLAVIAFHSVEDREVKNFFKSHAGKRESLQQGGTRWVGEDPPVAILTRKPVTPSDEELAANPRSRSAKLRAAERLQGGHETRSESEE